MTQGRSRFDTNPNLGDVRTHKLNFELAARRLVNTNIPDALRCATDIRERIVSLVSTKESSLVFAGNCAHM